MTGDDTGVSGSCQMTCQALDSVEGRYRTFVSCVGQLKWKT